MKPNTTDSGSSAQAGYLLRLRWGLLLVFPAGYFLTALRSAQSGNDLILNVISLTACAILLRQMNSFNPRKAALCVALALFVALYFLRYSYLSFDPVPLQSTLPYGVYVEMANDQESLRWAFAMSVAVFSIFCLASALLLYKGRGNDELDWNTGIADRAVGDKVATVILVILPVLMLILGYVANKYHIGQMGLSQGEPLPFRLKGVIFYARLIVLPILILLLIYLGTRAGNTLIEKAGLILLLVHGVSDTMLRGSRSSLLLCILLIIFMALSGGVRLRRTEIVISSIAGIAAVWLTPVIMQYRILRFVPNEGMAAVLQTAIGAANKNIMEALIGGFRFVYFRIPGVETMWAIGSLKAEPLGAGLMPTITSKFGIAGYLTFNLYQIPVDTNTLFAPGFVGWLYLVGGMAGLLVGAAGLAWICTGLPRYIYGSGLRSAPVINTFLLWILFVALTEGTLDGLVFMVAVGALSLAGIEILLRLAQRQRAVSNR